MSRERLLLASSCLFLVAVRASGQVPGFKIQVERDGVYRVAYEDLAAAGLSGSQPSTGLGVSRGDEPIPIWIEDGGDGVFGPGDGLEFVGQHLAGEYSYSSEYTRFNVYVLRFDHPQPARMTTPKRAVAASPSADSRYASTLHLEEDRLILRIKPPPGGASQELWYWAKLVHTQKKPFGVPLALAGLDPSVGGRADIKVQFRGWSQPSRRPDSIPDHRVEVRLGDEVLAAAEWNATDPYLVEVPSLPVERLASGASALELVVPKRAGDKDETLIDVSMLNWVEVTYPWRGYVTTDQASFHRVDPASPAAMRLVSDPELEFIVYGDQGSRMPASAMHRERQGDVTVSTWQPVPGESSFFVATTDGRWSPAGVLRDLPSRLAATTNRADYIMIAHPRLLAAIQPLAEHHRRRGLEVSVVDVEDVYDEYSHGVVTPEALRAFLAHAYHEWQRPAPCYVLLVGDASWDGKNSNAEDANYADWTYRQGETTQFAKNGSTLFAEDAAHNRRGLVPTWNHATYEGHAASDNYFVAVDGDDGVPDMAIGRLPVVTPEEVAGIVAKTVAYASSPEVGPWRRSVLYITNEERGFQHQSDLRGAELQQVGFGAEKIYPASDEPSNEHHSVRLIESIDRGQLVVHFLGHGGRYIWRTGPPDPKKNHDLFTLEHLDALQPSQRLPIVLSFTCYSAPFDHPNADSIGEKLLRLDGRGAVAVLAASWRNSPEPRWGQVLLEQLTVPGITVGEAILRAKQDIPSRMFIETYNLLGDPASPVAAPQASIALGVTHGADGAAGIRGEVGIADFTGSLIVDLLGGQGTLLRSVERELSGPLIDLDLGEDAAIVQAVRAYAWNGSRGIDAIGFLQITAPAPIEPPAAALRRQRAVPARVAN